MKSTLVCVLATCIVVGVAAQASRGGMSIGDATAFCEDAVPSYCLSTTCPLYCNTLRSARQRQRCIEGCTTANRCQLRPVGAGDDPTNRILDAQNRDQLFACIAEKRDPSGSTTGRRMQSWQNIRSPSYKKATRT